MKRALLHLISAALLLALAALQLNDPDALFWATVYGFAALVPLLRIAKRRPPALWGVALGLVWAGWLSCLPGFVDYLDSGEYALIGGAMSDDKPYVESAREWIGATAAALILFLGYGFIGRKARASGQASGPTSGRG